jgi:excisionase family DNA binding protein
MKHPAPLPQRLALSTEEAAASLGVSKRHIEQRVRTGEIPSVRLGKRVLIPLRQLENYLITHID